MKLYDAVVPVLAFLWFCALVIGLAVEGCSLKGLKSDDLSVDEIIIEKEFMDYGIPKV